MGAIKIDKLGAEDLPGPVAGGDPAVQVVTRPVTGLRPEMPAGLGVDAGGWISMQSAFWLSGAQLGDLAAAGDGHAAAEIARRRARRAAKRAQREARA